MNKTQSIKRTAYPDGTVINYLFGMEKPNITNLGAEMKAAAFDTVQRARERKAAERIVDQLNNTLR